MNWLRGAVQMVRERLAGRTRVKASLYYGGASIIAQVLRFAGVVLSTRLIGTEQFGLFAQATLWLSFAGLLKECGQSHALVSYSGSDRRYAVFNFQINATLCLIAAAALLGAARWLPAVPAALRSAAPILALIVLLDGFAQTGVVMAQKTFRFRLVGGTTIACTLTWLATIGILATRTGGLMALLLAQAAESGVRLLILGPTVIRQCIGWANGRDLRAYYFRKFAPVMIPQIALQTTAGRIDLLILSALSSLYEVGIYERMLQFMRIPWSLSINLIDQVLLASYAKEQSDPPALKRLLGKADRTVGIAVIAAAAATSIGYLLFLRFIVGPEWAGIILSRWWLALPLTLLTPLTIGWQIFFMGTGQPRHLLAVTAVKAVFDLLFGILLVPSYGAAGMLMAAAASVAVQLIYQRLAIRRYFANGNRSPEKSPPPDLNGP